MKENNINTLVIIRDILITNKNITHIHIHPFSSSPKLQSRVELNSVDNMHFGDAMLLRNRFSLPFWDSIMLSFYDKKHFSKKILSSVLLHSKRNKIKIGRQNVLNGELEEIENLEINYALNSNVLLAGNKEAHIPLLDFKIPESKENLVVVENVLKKLSLNDGYILASGKSYHYIGNKTITTDELITLLSKAVLFSPIIDKNWLGHQLIDRSCSLRFTKKYGILPKVVKIMRTYSVE